MSVCMTIWPGNSLPLSVGREEHADWDISRKLSPRPTSYAVKYGVQYTEP
jgi:hypothetical protein